MLPEMEELLRVLDQGKEKLAESRSLYESLEAGERPERVPINPGCTNEQFKVLKQGLTMGEYRSHPETALKTELKSWSWSLQEFPEEDATAISVAPRIQGGATVAAAFCEVEHFDHHAGFGVKPALADIKDVDKLKVPHPEEVPSVQRLCEFADYFVRQLGDHVGDTPGGTSDGRWVDSSQISLAFSVPVMPFTEAAMIRGETDFLMDLVLHPREAKQLIEIATEAEVRIIKYLRKRYGLSDPGICGVADDAVSMLSPEMYEEFAVPYQKMAIEQLSSAGKVSYHLCGQSQHLLSSIKEYIDPLYINISYFTDLTYASEIMGDTIFLGGPNPRVVLQGSREAIRENVLDTLQQGIRHGLYMFGAATSAWDPETPIENIHHAYSLVREHTSAVLH